MIDVIEPLIWDENPAGKFCVLGGLNGVERQYEIKRGISRAKGFPSDAYFQMDKEFKKQVALSDNLANLETLPVVSNRLKAFIQAREPANVEYLPVRIIDHKGKDAQEEYHIVNPLEIVDCIDRDKSQVEWNVIDPDLIAGVYSLVLKLETIGPSLLLFRPKHLERRIFVRADFAAELEAESFSGLEFREISDYTG